MLYKVLWIVEEVYEAETYVDANSKEEATEKADNKFNNSDLVLKTSEGTLKAWVE